MRDITIPAGTDVFLVETAWPAVVVSEGVPLKVRSTRSGDFIDA